MKYMNKNINYAPKRRYELQNNKVYIDSIAWSIIICFNLYNNSFVGYLFCAINIMLDMLETHARMTSCTPHWPRYKSQDAEFF